VRSGDAEIPGVGPADRDRILAAQVLFFLPDLGQALRAYRHILRPGGVLAVSSWGPEEKRWLSVYKAMFASIPEGAAPSLTPSGDAFRSDKTVATTLEDAGFVDVRSITETYDVVFDNADQWLSWSRSHGGRAYWDAIPADRRAAARTEAMAALAPLAEPNGRLVAATTVRYTLATRP
jgi:trans-aconitate methyltransferase